GPARGLTHSRLSEFEQCPHRSPRSFPEPSDSTVTRHREKSRLSRSKRVTVVRPCCYRTEQSLPHFQGSPDVLLIQTPPAFPVLSILSSSIQDCTKRA